MKFNRYLVFYIILGLGLVTSWILVGKRARIAPDLGVRIMSVDDACRPFQAPCGAYAQHFALVLGPVGDGHALRLVGEQLPPDARLSALQYDDKAQQLEPPLFKSLEGGTWRLEPAREAVRVRVNLVSGRNQWLAEFPLASRERRFSASR